MQVEIIPVCLPQDVVPGDDLVKVLLETKNGRSLKDGDILVCTQKIISKQEGQKIELSSVEPTFLATGLANAYSKDARVVQLILDESRRIVRMKNGVIISETHHGLVCANAGVDESNVEEGFVTLLPGNPNKSAQKIRRLIKIKTRKKVAVIISDTFGRPFREGQMDIAIGFAGISPIVYYSGKRDDFGRILRVTAIAIVDEICSASELVRGKTLKTPIAIVRHYNFNKKNGKLKDLIRIKTKDMFR